MKLDHPWHWYWYFFKQLNGPFWNKEASWAKTLFYYFLITPSLFLHLLPPLTPLYIFLFLPPFLRTSTPPACLPACLPASLPFFSGNANSKLSTSLISHGSPMPCQLGHDWQQHEMCTCGPRAEILSKKKGNTENPRKYYCTTFCITSYHLHANLAQGDNERICVGYFHVFTSHCTI